MHLYPNGLAFLCAAREPTVVAAPVQSLQGLWTARPCIKFASHEAAFLSRYFVPDAEAGRILTLKPVTASGQARACGPGVLLFVLSAKGCAGSPRRCFRILPCAMLCLEDNEASPAASERRYTQDLQQTSLRRLFVRSGMVSVSQIQIHLSTCPLAPWPVRTRLTWCTPSPAERCAHTKGKAFKDCPVEYRTLT